MSDKFFNKRKAVQKKELIRNKAIKLERKRVLIVCEGSKTEPSYFKKLISYFSLNTVDIEICGKECGSDPLSVVKYGKDRLDKDSDFDFVFFVFDKDAHSAYDSALSKISDLSLRYRDNISIHAITSNPCFELWLLMHFTSSSRPYCKTGRKSPADCLISELKKQKAFKGYIKGKCNYFDEIKDKTDDAIKNSLSVLNSGMQTSDNQHHINPATLVHELVNILKDVASEY